MEFTDFQTGKDDVERRLDKVLRIMIPQLSLPEIYKSLRKGLIKVNGKARPQDYRIAEGDVIGVAKFLLEGKNTPDEQKEAFSLDKVSVTRQINSMRIFENEHILVLNKASGINVHSSVKNQVSLQTLVEFYYDNCCKNDSLSFRPGPLHRIDRFTSGIVCFSKSNTCATWFTDLMKDHKIQKNYAAIVTGKVLQQETWEDYLQKEEEDKSFYTVKVYSKDDPERPKDSKACKTTIIPVKSFEYKKNPLTFCYFDIETGRQHQIRAQSAFHGHALWGDTAYGAAKITENNGSFYLCAYSLKLPENDLGIPQELKIELPDCFIKLVGV